MTQVDTLQRFLIEDLNLRGEILVLEQTLADLIGDHNYPPAIREQLGQTANATLLLSATLKIQGSTSIQARGGNGALGLLVAEATDRRTLRGIARLRDGLDPSTLPEDVSLTGLLGEGATLAITLTPRKGQRYQGIVPLEHGSLDKCLEAYFDQSEQLETTLRFFSWGQRLGGILLQELPDAVDPEQRENNWEHALQLLNTLTPEELCDLPAEKVLYRLFHEHQVRLMPGEPVSFACSCSEERTLKALDAMDADTLREIIAEQGHLEMRCEFCGQVYRFSAEQIERIADGPQIH